MLQSVSCSVMTPTALVALVESIAIEAGSRIQTSLKQNPVLDVSNKKDGSPVTNLDIETQDFIQSQLIQHTPFHNVLGEEDADNFVKIETPFWVIDPIDGTANVVSGTGRYAISVALVEKNTIRLGVVYDPVSDDLYSAHTGQGAYHNGVRLACARKAGPEGGRILLDAGRKTRTVLFQQQVRNLIVAKGITTTAIECASLELCLVAQGRYDGCIHPGLKIWDIAAGMCVAREAGVHISNLLGDEKNIYEEGIVAASPFLHNMLVEVTTHVLDSEESSL
jgi:myo-inositol-1(or 4)-monophosphatase